MRPCHWASLFDESCTTRWGTRLESINNVDFDFAITQQSEQFACDFDRHRMVAMIGLWQI